MTRRKRKPRPCAAPTMVLILLGLELHDAGYVAAVEKVLREKLK